MRRTRSCWSAGRSDGTDALTYRRRRPAPRTVCRVPAIFLAECRNRPAAGMGLRALRPCPAPCRYRGATHRCTRSLGPAVRRAARRATGRIDGLGVGSPGPAGRCHNGQRGATARAGGGGPARCGLRTCLRRDHSARGSGPLPRRPRLCAHRNRARAWRVLPARRHPRSVPAGIGDAAAARFFRR